MTQIKLSQLCSGGREEETKGTFPCLWSLTVNIFVLFLCVSIRFTYLNDTGEFTRKQQSVRGTMKTKALDVSISQAFEMGSNCSREIAGIIPPEHSSCFSGAIKKRTNFGTVVETPPKAQAETSSLGISPKVSPIALIINCNLKIWHRGGNAEPY